MHAFGGKDALIGIQYILDESGGGLVRSQMQVNIAISE